MNIRPSFFSEAGGRQEGEGEETEGTAEAQQCPDSRRGQEEGKQNMSNNNNRWCGDSGRGQEEGKKNDISWGPPPQKLKDWLKRNKKGQPRMNNAQTWGETKKKVNRICKTSGFWPRVRARALRAPVFSGSLPHQPGRCAPPRLSQLRCFLFDPPKIKKLTISRNKNASLQDQTWAARGVYLSTGLSCTLLSYAIPYYRKLCCILRAICTLWAKL